MPDSRTALVVLLLSTCFNAAALANGDYEPAEAQAFMQANCARCHAIGHEGTSPFEPAPPLRDIALRYAIEGLAEAFAEGIVVGHPAMPEFELEPEEIDLLLDYLSWLGGE